MIRIEKWENEQNLCREDNLFQLTCYLRPQEVVLEHEINGGR